MALTYMHSRIFDATTAFAAGCGLVLAALLGGASVAHAQTSTSTFACKPGESYLFQGDATTVVKIDLSSGTSNTASSPIIPAASGNQKLNAFGYNQRDNYIGGQRTNTSQVVRVNSDYTATIWDVANLTGDVTAAVVGDVSPSGIMYLTRGGSGAGATGAAASLRNIYAIDLTPSLNKTTPDKSLTATLLTTTPPPTYITDWAVSPIDNNLYAIYSTISGSSAPPALTLYRFQTGGSAPGTREELGTVVAGTPVSKDGTDHPIVASNFGAAFMDSQGNFFVVANETGYIYRIDTPDKGNLTAHYVAAAPAGASNTDGARCPATAVAPLPVTLVSFTAAAAPNRAVRLDWQTASEFNNAYFEVQRSLDGQHFTALSQVKGHGTPGKASAYSFTDAAPGDAATCYYRLRQVDLDGSFSFGPTRAVGLAPGSSLVQLAVAPNPTTTGNLRVEAQYAGAAPAPAVLTVRNLLGQSLLTQAIAVQPGANVFTPSAALAPGVYWLSLSGEAVAGAPSVRVLVAE